MSVQNSTSSFYENSRFYEMASFGCALIIVSVCVSGTAVNLISLYIFTRIHFRVYSINILLAALSAVDACLLFLVIPAFTAAQFGPFLNGLISPPDISSIILRIYPVTLMFQCASVWLLVVITVERYIVVCHPFAVALYCTRRRAVLAVLSTLLASMAFNYVRFWEYRRTGSGAIEGHLRSRPLYMILYINVATNLTQFLLPLSILCSFNYLVGRTIMRAVQQRRALTAIERREHTTAKMMLFVVLVFVCCYSLSFALNVTEIWQPEMFKNPFGYLLNDLNNILVIINSSSSFLLYRKYSSRFRLELNSLFCPAKYQASGNKDTDRTTVHRDSMVTLRQRGKWRQSSGTVCRRVEVDGCRRVIGKERSVDGLARVSLNYGSLASNSCPQMPLSSCRRSQPNNTTITT